MPLVYTMISGWKWRGCSRAGPCPKNLLPSPGFGGLYGAGKVEIWDSGEYELQQAEPDLLTFTLHGSKLQGQYALVHTNAANWLLLKRKELYHSGGKLSM
jgi:hypothetical protein